MVEELWTADVEIHLHDKGFYFFVCFFVYYYIRLPDGSFVIWTVTNLIKSDFCKTDWNHF